MQQVLYTVFIYLFCNCSVLVARDSTNPTLTKDCPEAETILKLADTFDKNYNFYINPKPSHNLEDSLPLLKEFSKLGAQNPEALKLVPFKTLVTMIKIGIILASHDDTLEPEFQNFLKKTRIHLSIFILKESIRLNSLMMNFVKEKDPKEIQNIFWESMRGTHHVHFLIHAVSQYLEDPSFFHEHTDVYIKGKFRLSIMINSFTKRIPRGLEEIEFVIQEKNALANLDSFKDFDDYGRYAVAGQLMKQELHKISHMNEVTKKFYITLLNLLEEHIAQAKGINEIIKNTNLPNAVVLGF